MPNNIVDLEIDEVSLVDNPANAELDESGKKIQRARIALFKRDRSGESHTRKCEGVEGDDDVVDLPGGKEEDLDDDDDEEGVVVKYQRSNPKETDMSLVTVLKAAVSRGANRKEIEQLVNAEALRIAKAGDPGGAQTIAKLWSDPDVYDAYEAARLPTLAELRPEQQSFQKAESVSVVKQLQLKATEIAKRDNITEAAAFNKAMLENPNLYEQYERAQHGC